MHLFARLDTHDERLGLSSYPHRWIPLFFGIHFASYCSRFVYTCSDDGEVCLIEHLPFERIVHDPDFPYEGHPESFPEVFLTCKATDFDPRRPKDAVEYQGVFDLQGLPPDLIPEAIRYGLYDPGIVPWSRADVYSDWDDETILRCLGVLPFFQDSPSRRCKNRACSGWAADWAGEKSVDVIAVLHSDATDGFWDNAVIQFVFSLCRICHAVHADYQCT